MLNLTLPEPIKQTPPKSGTRPIIDHPRITISQSLNLSVRRSLKTIALNARKIIPYNIQF